MQGWYPSLRNIRLLMMNAEMLRKGDKDVWRFRLQASSGMKMDGYHYAFGSKCDGVARAHQQRYLHARRTSHHLLHIMEITPRVCATKLRSRRRWLGLDRWRGYEFKMTMRGRRSGPYLQARSAKTSSFACFPSKRCYTLTAMNRQPHKMVTLTGNMSDSRVKGCSGLSPLQGKTSARSRY